MHIYVFFVALLDAPFCTFIKTNYTDNFLTKTCIFFAFLIPDSGKQLTLRKTIKRLNGDFTGKIFQNQD